ncbi:hypothetical protein PPL_05299 [Heterostelium album PN500]|uniref:Uncharacterized protein n=1 Tax=Heterostelium pallidum (strain ATCC 26659 / Pp 5 / PN500) TaxID=670386 RepID=D3BBB2_HETP5|nr:hypothetical protein PPL_05299 [Heterostelium album PN500]EFA81319.1 hypothetical protein PPL_05299 [Heterostelium album PN500]|eukprot:XP_020433437.1 hypothetical protein PPL_05299 [Heterostelium album PN500]
MDSTFTFTYTGKKHRYFLQNKDKKYDMREDNFFLPSYERQAPDLELTIDYNFDEKVKQHLKYFNNITASVISNIKINYEFNYQVHHIYFNINKKTHNYELVDTKIETIKKQQVINHSYNITNYLKEYLEDMNTSAFRTYATFRDARRYPLVTSYHPDESCKRTVISWFEARYTYVWGNELNARNEATKLEQEERTSRAKSEVDLVEAVNNKRIVKLYIRDFDRSFFEVDSLSGQKLKMEISRKANFIQFIKNNGFNPTPSDPNLFVFGTVVPF